MEEINREREKKSVARTDTWNGRSQSGVDDVTEKERDLPMLFTNHPSPESNRLVDRKEENGGKKKKKKRVRWQENRTIGLKHLTSHMDENLLLFFPLKKYKSPGFLCSHVASSTGPLSHTRGGMTRCD